ncbi:hypothetical protein HAX54_051233 [Datura stramonium]|uniref:Uncharacterized protein n=1 Tax=Datura stramonium TaxID=4076 RepID=A0ABS8WPD9_DATST|nr:hypothetical protein [Datura stramonium]
MRGTGRRISTIRLFCEAHVDVAKLDKSEDVKHNAILELGQMGPHSKYFSTLSLVGNLEIEPSKPMERCAGKGKSESTS